jgi:hypothetical protein
MASIRYDRYTVMIPSTNALYIVNHKGTFTIRARDIDRLHSALVPFLSGGIEESALLESVGSNQRRMVETYLHELQEIQALGSTQEEKTHTLPSTGRTPDMLGPRLRAGLVDIGDQQVFVSLDGSSAVASPSDSRLLFVSFAEAGRHLLEWDREPGSLVLVAVKDNTNFISDAHIERRLAYARWILHNDNVVSRQPALRVFVLQDDGTMVRSVSLEASSPGALRELPHRLKLIQPVDVDQVPLAVATLDHPFFSIVKSAATMHFKEASGYLLNSFAIELASVGQLSFRASKYGFTPKEQFIRGPSTSDRGSAPLVTWPIARSSAELIISLLETYADGCRGSGPVPLGTELDLFSYDCNSPEITYFVRVLRRGVCRLIVTLSKTEEGLFICTNGKLRTRSFLPNKAIRDLLVELVWKMFYEDKYGIEDPYLCCGYDGLIDQAGLRRLLHERAASLAARHEFPRLRLNAIKLWGNTTWTGTIEQ